jgi:glycosyltransferase involved in cell wall biosynthesis
VDRRVRVLNQRNLGVAAARNAGWRSSIAEYIAFVDADDLWAPTKIERQLGALRAAGPRAGLAYCWMATIDEAGHVLRQYGGTHHEGDVLDAMLLSNLVGCGSTPLLRRQALIDAGGFDSRLRAAQAEGCEDWLLYARVAGAWHYALVPEVLVGYRQRARSMSSDRLAMLRSHVLMCEQLVPLHPQRLRAMHRGLSGYCVHLISMTPRGQWASRVALWWALRRHPRAALRALALDLPLLALRRVRARLTPRRRREPAALPPSRQFLPRS